MCWWDNPAPRTFKCGHTVNEPPERKLVKCSEAKLRGSACDTIQNISKGSSKTRQFDCPACREVHVLNFVVEAEMLTRLHRPEPNQ